MNHSHPIDRRFPLKKSVIIFFSETLFQIERVILYYLYLRKVLSSRVKLGVHFCHQSVRDTLSPTLLHVITTSVFRQKLYSAFLLIKLKFAPDYFLSPLATRILSLEAARCLCHRFGGQNRLSGTGPRTRMKAASIALAIIKTISLVLLKRSFLAIRHGEIVSKLY